jgi:hypothetical protein
MFCEQGTGGGALHRTSICRWGAAKGENGMAGPQKNTERDDLITMEILADAYGPVERAMKWHFWVARGYMLGAGGGGLFVGQGGGAEDG